MCVTCNIRPASRRSKKITGKSGYLRGSAHFSFATTRFLVPKTVELGLRLQQLNLQSFSWKFFAVGKETRFSSFALMVIAGCLLMPYRPPESLAPWDRKKHASWGTFQIVHSFIYRNETRSLSPPKTLIVHWSRRTRNPEYKETYPN
jgi:hypothetical protein